MSAKVSIRVHYDRRSSPVALLALTLLMVISLSYLAWSQQEAAASDPHAPLVSVQGGPLAASTGLRQYYLTKNTYTGVNASTACDTGYHFASLWEILDPSSLKYNTDKGFTTDDSGHGPPTTGVANAWVRTGYDSNASDTDPTGQVNCDAWTSESLSDWGTYVRLSDDWENSFTQNVHVWNTTQGVCANTLHVWCIADSVSLPVYLPIILKSY